MILDRAGYILERKNAIIYKERDSTGEIDFKTVTLIKNLEKRSFEIHLPEMSIFIPLDDDKISNMPLSELLDREGLR